MKTKAWIILFITFITGAMASAQEDSLKNQAQKSFVTNTFSGTRLINSQTTKILPKKSWTFEIQHRFGKTGIDSSFIEQFMGLDLPSSIRFAFGWSISERFYLEVGRTNNLKTYDLEGKWLLAKQTEDFRMPFSIAAYFDAAIRTEKWPKVPDNSFFEDDSTSFRYKPSHRLAYNTQILLSSKINDKLSFQLNPTFLYRNLASPYTDNFTLVLTGGGRYKINHRTGIVFEYSHIFNNRTDDFLDPVSIGFEFGTAGHSFQIFAGTSSSILESRLYNKSAVHYPEGEFIIGFNLQRSFWRKK